MKYIFSFIHLAFWNGAGEWVRLKDAELREVSNTNLHGDPYALELWGKQFVTPQQAEFIENKIENLKKEIENCLTNAY